jgi:hypothetical protein
MPKQQLQHEDKQQTKQQPLLQQEEEPRQSPPKQQWQHVSYGPPWAHYLGGYQDRLLGGPLGLPGLRYTAPEGVEQKDYTGVVLG